MKLRKVMTMTAFAIGLVSISALAQAKDLTIINNTDKDSSSVINGGMCSNKLPGGVTKAGTTNVVSSKVIGLACLGHSSDCKADVYMNNNCSGVKVGTVIFDTSKGILSRKMDTKAYEITFNAFTIQLDHGSTLASR